ncbi:MAG: helix-turn-helix transcriptional regulator [Alistipes senegalensis]|nr:helix-turn-helix transcriptional regulator [Oxalobacter formigenes]MCM1281515.1 helix-turn-helix transcriptional regulator [Alistipes senegalensis]
MPRIDEYIFSDYGNVQVIDMVLNKFDSPDVLNRCVPMGRLQSVLGGKWKLLILWYIAFYKVQRFNELFRRLDGITQATLSKQLKDLETDGFIHREVYREVPQKVEYTLTLQGESFIPVLNKMVLWSADNLCGGYKNTLLAEMADDNENIPNRAG